MWVSRGVLGCEYRPSGAELGVNERIVREIVLASFPIHIVFVEC